MRLPKVVPHAELCEDLDHDGDILSILLTQALAKSLACHKAALQFIQLRNGFLGLVVGGLAQLCHLDTAVFRCVFHIIQGHVVMHATDCTVHERQNATRLQSTRTSTVGCIRPAWKQRLCRTLRSISSVASHTRHTQRLAPCAVCTQACQPLTTALGASWSQQPLHACPICHLTVSLLAHALKHVRHCRCGAL